MCDDNQLLAELLTLTMTLDEYGDITYTNQAGELHRVHGPAVIWADGERGWYQHGRRHRVDGPAVTLPDGSEHWYISGRRHRVGGPASVFAGDRVWEWWENGVCLMEESMDA